MTAVAQLEQSTKAMEKSLDRPSLEAQGMETIGRLVSGVAHDFNNLLTGIVLCSDLLLAGLEKDSRLWRYAQEIRSASSHAADIVGQLAEVARTGPNETVSLSFNDVICEIRNLLVRLIGENIQLTVELAEHLEAVKINPAQARQIILNLALNARDAMPEGGQLRIITRNIDHDREENRTDWVELEVRDTGIGMDAQTRSRICEPFFTTKSSGKGTGLGLATVLRIVRQHRGTIEIASQPGKGTQVVVRLPGEKRKLKEKDSKYDKRCTSPD
ncbi:MAG TPA: ATP-binding protein [Terriglobales bacterium]|nr:ATP-binding protein [Terriglobales bacterium]